MAQADLIKKFVSGYSSQLDGYSCIIRVRCPQGTLADTFGGIVPLSRARAGVAVQGKFPETA
jgi:hypothetical protein